MEIQAAIHRLHYQLPLQARQDQLTPTLKQLHKLILRALAEQGAPPGRTEMIEVVGSADFPAALQRLGEMDLVVLDQSHSVVLGAYPLTIETTPHQLRMGQYSIYAMCALDAVSVAPMFATEVMITSRCHVSGEPVQIHMQGHDVLRAQPATVMVGIRWQMPSAVAAHSMCTEMVFLKDWSTAQRWQGDEVDTISLFTLPESIAFGAGFFMPLLEA